jgi:putative transposase
MLWFCVWQIVSTLIELVRLGRRSESGKDLEILLLRRQLAIYERRQERAPHLSRGEKLTLVALATMFDYTPEIRRLIYTTNLIEGYNRQLRKVTKNRAAFPSPEAARKLLWLAHRDIAKKWTMPIPNWAIILNQLAIRFEDRFPI